MYSVQYTKSALKSRRKLPRDQRDRIRARINELAENPRKAGLDIKPLRNSPYWRLRVGPWRVVYEIRDDQLAVVVIRIGSRGEVYE